MHSSVAAVAAGLLWLSAPLAHAEAKLPQPDHVVLVVMENHSFAQIADPRSTPFISRLASGGALFLNAYAVAHPSEPNYFALFSGSTFGVHDDGFHSLNGPTLASALAAAHKSFIGYVETGSPRKHNPWESFAGAHGVERNFVEFPSDFAALPTVSFVVPNLMHDMHDGSVRAGDRWLQAHLGGYAEWARTHNSLLIVTFDEDDDRAGNRIPTIIYGGRVRPGRYAEHITHYSVLSTLLALYAVRPLADIASVPPIGEIWQPAAEIQSGTKAASGSKL